MCFSFVGRIQTRLVSLLVAWAIAWLFSVSRGTSAYLVLFGVMAVVTLLLDVALYAWVLDFQPRWLTLVLAIFEFFVIKWVVEWPYPLEVRLRTRQALEFYLVAWSINWLLLFVILPRFFPRWNERAGQLWVCPTGRSFPIALRRRVFGRTLLISSLVLMPWLVGHSLAGTERFFSGVLVGSPWHLTSFGHMLVGERGVWSTPSALLGWLSATGWWSPFTVYQISQALGLVISLLGLQLLLPRLAWAGLALASVILVMLPPSWPWMLGIGLALARLGGSREVRLERRTTGVVWIGVAVLWGWLWLQLWFAPLAFLSQGEMQVSAWLAQQPTRPLVWSSDQRLMEISRGFGAAELAADQAQAEMVLVRGSACQHIREDEVWFRHGQLCAVRGSQP